jgi:hypothetical protein
MNDFASDCSELARLQTFDPSVFEGDEETPQEVCSFVLSLALAWNDCKDISYARELLRRSKPGGDPCHSRVWGAYGGIDLHVFRLEVSAIRDLLELFARNRSLLESEGIADMVKLLPPNPKHAWQALVDIAQGGEPSDVMGRCIKLVRDELAFQYDPEKVYRGYRHHFFDEDREDEVAFVSRGGSASASRFYFADAATLGHVDGIPGGQQWEGLRADVHATLTSISWALMGVVDQFVRRRAGAYAEFEEQVV